MIEPVTLWATIFQALELPQKDRFLPFLLLEKTSLDSLIAAGQVFRLKWGLTEPVIWLDVTGGSRPSPYQ